MDKRIARAIVAIVAVAATLAACASQEQKNRAAVDNFRQSTAGQYRSEAGARLFIAPVRARMVTDEAIYVEHHAPNGTVIVRIVDVAIGKDGKKILQRALAFTQDGQWRNLRENPELLTALLPKDVRPAGSCDIQPAEDGNSLSYSCGGSPPEKFTRQ
jgi:hypothetical protein